MRRGVYYGVPEGLRLPKKCNLVVVGGGNSAGQAAMWLSRNQLAQVKLFTRSPLEKEMSQYLIDRIKVQPNVEVCIGCEVQALEGSDWLKGVHYLKGRPSGALESAVLDASYLFIFIGAIPQTVWLKDKIDLDEKKFILTGRGVSPDALLFETSLPGVFAAGDIRAGSIKRIAAAIGEGSSCIAMIHQYLAATTLPTLPGD
jgi:thioredoxin reductase (NADPH)